MKNSLAALGVSIALLIPSVQAEVKENFANTEVESPENSSAEIQATPVLTAEEKEQQYLAAVQKIWDGFDKRQGQIKLPNGIASVQIPDNFYYLGPDDAERLLVDLWGNPPSAEKSLGMIFPAKHTPVDAGAWAVTIDYTEDGYVSDDDAEAIDYDSLLSQMKDDTHEASKEREKQGYGTVDLIGWAARPYYDADSHKLHWAKEVKFDAAEENTLNYNIRVLGRKGVLILNFIAGMQQKEVIDASLNNVLAMASFDEGSKYEDFNPDIDKVAAYGIAALVAGKVASKLGFLAIALVFLKKFGFLLIIPIVWLFNFLRGKKKEKEPVK